MYYAKVIQSRENGTQKTLATFASNYHSEIEEDIRRTLVDGAKFTPIQRDTNKPRMFTVVHATLETSNGTIKTEYYCAGRAVIAHDQEGCRKYRLVRPYPASMLAYNYSR